MTFDSFEMRAISRLATRRLRYAIVASLLLHLLILWPASLRVLTKDTPSPLQATLHLRPQPSAESVPSKPLQRAVARPQSGLPGTQSEPIQTLAPTARKPESPALEQPKPLSEEIGDRPQFHESRNRGLSPISSPTEPVLKPLSGPESAPAAAAAPVPAGVAGGPGGSLMTEANTSGEAMDGLRGYRLALATQARRFKRYPAQAMASGWVGSAEIRVEVGSDGRPQAATVARSSGHEALDRAALTMIEAGALRARLPESLRGKAFAVVLPVVFNLDDE